MPDNAHNHGENPTSAADVLGLLAQISDKFEPSEAAFRDWIMQYFPNPQIIEVFQEATPVMLRALDAIGQLEPVNGIRIAEHQHIPKGTVSKVTRKLIAQGLITSESLPNNKKEVLFRLTPLGGQVFHAHRAFDQQMERGFYIFMERYTPDQLSFLAQVLQDVLDTSFLELGEKSR